MPSAPPAAPVAPAESLAHPRLWVGFAIMMLVPGFGNGFPVFFPPLLGEFHGSRAATALAITLLWAVGAVFGPLSGYLVDRRDPRLVVGAGLVVAAAGLLVGAFAPTLAVFSLAVGVGAGVGVGLAGMVSQAAVVANTYVRQRGFAIGIVFSGSMAGYLLATPAHWAITTVGWRGALVGWAAAIVALLPLMWWTFPARLGERAAAAAPPDVRATLWSVPFAALAVLFALAPFVGFLATTQHAVYVETLGFSAWEGSAMLMLGGVLSTTGRALAGLVADRLGAAAAGFLSYGATLAGILSLIALDLWPGRVLAYAYVVLVFLPLGTRATIVSVLVGRIAPAAAFGTIFGVLAIGNSLGAAAGPLLSGAIYDVTGSYMAVYVTAAGFVLIALAALAVFVRTTPSHRS